MVNSQQFSCNYGSNFGQSSSSSKLPLATSRSRSSPNVVQALRSLGIANVRESQPEDTPKNVDPSNLM